jgi:predicted PurR-regulated permease PerM
VGELVSNLGPIIAAIPLIAVGFLSSTSQGLLAIVLAILIQQLENNLIVPRVMGQAVDLHPVAVMLAILAGNQLATAMGGWRRHCNSSGPSSRRSDCAALLDS